mgnify:CR=1 FL=1
MPSAFFPSWGWQRYFATIWFNPNSAVVPQQRASEVQAWRSEDTQECNYKDLFALGNPVRWFRGDFALH